MRIEIQQNQTRVVHQLSTEQIIEQEFQDYFKVLLYKHNDDCYSVPEWNHHFNWGNRQFTLKQLDVLLRGHKHLASIVPEVKSFSWLNKAKLV